MAKKPKPKQDFTLEDLEGMVEEIFHHAIDSRDKAQEAIEMAQKMSAALLTMRIQQQKGELTILRQEVQPT